MTPNTTDSRIRQQLAISGRLLDTTLKIIVIMAGLVMLAMVFPAFLPGGAAHTVIAGGAR